MFHIHTYLPTYLICCLFFYRCVNITDIGIGYLSTMPTLQILFLRWCSQIRDNGVQHLSTMRNLEILSLAGKYYNYVHKISYFHRYLVSTKYLNPQCLSWIRPIPLYHDIDNSKGHAKMNHNGDVMRSHCYWINGIINHDFFSLIHRVIRIYNLQFFRSVQMLKIRFFI